MNGNNSVLHRYTHTAVTYRVVGVRTCSRRPEPSQPEVGDSQLAPLRGQDVARLEVAVDDAVVVKKLKSSKKSSKERTKQQGKIRRQSIVVCF